MMPDPTFPEIADSYDVVILGGALSGAATAILLQKRNPGIRILIVEKAETLTRRVGEATVEVSAFFMSRVLGMTRFLNETQIAKQGLRFWFQNEKVDSLDQASEIGARYNVRLPSYQLDRSIFDEEVLRRAVEGGATVVRPATVRTVELADGGHQSIDFKFRETHHRVTARWVVDASGVAALLARKNGWLQRNTEHPTASAWSRWKGVKDWDGLELAEKFPCWAKVVHGIRGTATNHLIGDGWWAWMIPLKGGDTSIGVVFDQRIVDWPDGGSVGERLKDFLMKHPVGAEMLEHAEYETEDVHWRRNLAYYSTTFAGDGFVLVGDAAAFMDPFYSPGMDWIAFTTSCAANLITRQRDGERMNPIVAQYNHDFSISHSRWFNALYKDKYHYMGEFDLLNLAFRLDLGLYYWGVVQPPFVDGPGALLEPPFSPPSGRFFSALMGCYNRRFVAIAKRRRRLGIMGRMNDRNRSLIPGYTLERKNMLRLFPLLKEWAVLELREGWRTWGRAEEESPDMAPMPAQPGTQG